MVDGKAAFLASLSVKIASILVFLFTTPLGLAVVVLSVLFVLSLRIAGALRSAVVAERAAGGRLGGGAAFFVAFDATIGFVGKLVALIPALALFAAAALSLVTVGNAVARVEEAAAAAARIKELRSVVRNLERSVKVAEIRVLSREGGVTRLALSYFDPASGSGPVGSREMEIRGSDIYFDAIVLNFRYSEIEEGRRTNISIPYRVFSDEVPQSEGLPLGAVDGEGIPYAFHRADEDIYGLAPEAFRSRLAELMEIAGSDAAARKDGIVRSLYGSAVHRRVRPGDVMELRVEETGGMTLKEKIPF